MLRRKAIRSGLEKITEADLVGPGGQVRDKGKGRDRKRRRGPIGRKEERVGKNAHKSAHNVSSLHCYLNGFMEISLIGRLSFLRSPRVFFLLPQLQAELPPSPSPLRRQVPTDLHSFSGTCPWPCSPAPDSILFSGGPALEEKQKWVSLERVRGQRRSFCKRCEACCSYKRVTYSTNIQKALGPGMIFFKTFIRFISRIFITLRCRECDLYLFIYQCIVTLQCSVSSAVQQTKSAILIHISSLSFFFFSDFLPIQVTTEH